MSSQTRLESQLLSRTTIDFKQKNYDDIIIIARTSAMGAVIGVVASVSIAAFSLSYYYFSGSTTALTFSAAFAAGCIPFSSFAGCTMGYLNAKNSLSLLTY